MITIAVAIVGRLITKWGAKQKRSHEQMYKTNAKKLKILKVSSFAMEKM